MKKLFAVAVLLFVVAALGFTAPAAYSGVPQAQIIRVQDQQAPTPNAADQAAYGEFQVFAQDHMLTALGRYHVSDDGKTITGFDLALATTDADGDTEIKWVVYGYPTVREASIQIEADFIKYSDGNPDGTTYQARASLSTSRN